MAQEKTSKKKINFMPIFISCFIFVSLGINYYVLEYKSKSMVENSTKDLVLYEKIAMLEKNISNTPQKEDKNNYQKDIEDLRNKNKALEEAIALSTEALMKQKMEIATLVEKINIVSGGSDGNAGVSVFSSLIILLQEPLHAQEWFPPLPACKRPLCQQRPRTGPSPSSFFLRYHLSCR